MRLFWIPIAGILLVNSINAQDIMFPTESTDASVRGSFGGCSTPNREQGECINLNQCKSLLSLLSKTPLTTQDRLYLQKSQCGNVGNDVLVCCPLSSNLFPDDCGRGNVDKIYGGVSTKIDEYPWMALLNYNKPDNQKGFHCGGVLITNRYVLTASHCVNGKAIPATWRLTSVRLGEWNTDTLVDCEGDLCNDAPLDIPIEQAIPHEGYQPNLKSQHNDIALLRLSRSVKYTDWIKPICLPSAQHLKNARFEKIPMDVAGWGKTEVAQRSNVKLKARVHGTNLNTCSQTYRSQGITLEDSQFCAGGEEGIDSCSGDSGGPVMTIDNTNRAKPYFFVAGLVSFGPTECGKAGWPGVYTRVGNYVDWIRGKIRA